MAEIRLRPHVTLSDLQARLRDQANEAHIVVNSLGRHPKDDLDSYLGWVNQAWRMLESHLRRAELEQLLHTRHYWALRQMVGNEGWLTGQLKVELNACREALGEMADEARELERRWGMVSGVIVVPDTNLLLHTTKFFDDLDWPTALDIIGSVHLAITMVVIDQIDSLKRNKQVRSRARQTANRIERVLGEKPLERVILMEDSHGETTISVLADSLEHERLADSDSEIVDRAAYLNDLATVPVYVATWDNLMRVRAAIAGVPVIKPRPEYELPDETPDGSRGRRIRVSDPASIPSSS